MSPTCRWCLLVACALCGAIPADVVVAQGAGTDVQIKEVDLATLASGQPVRLTIWPGKWRFVIVNRVPSQEVRYTLATEGKVYEAPPLANQPGGFMDKPASADTCTALHAAVAALEKESAEDRVQGRIRAVTSARDKATGCAGVVLVANEAIQRTRGEPTEPWTFSAAADAVVELTITITRTDKDAATPARVWSVTFATPEGTRPAWRTTFGYAFISLPWWGDKREYRVQRIGTVDEPRYTIAQAINPDVIKPVPAIFFSHTAAPAGAGRPAEWFWTAGLGASNNNGMPNALLGFGVRHYQNLELVAGFASVGVPVRAIDIDTTKTAPDNGSINRTRLEVRPFIALAWRFASNPFAVATTPAKPKTAEPAKAADAAKPAEPAKPAESSKR